MCSAHDNDSGSMDSPVNVYRRSLPHEQQLPVVPDPLLAENLSLYLALSQNSRAARPVSGNTYGI
jgi:hypothetical protein